MEMWTNGRKAFRVGGAGNKTDVVPAQPSPRTLRSTECYALFRTLLRLAYFAIFHCFRLLYSHRYIFNKILKLRFKMINIPHQLLQLYSNVTNGHYSLLINQIKIFLQFNENYSFCM